MGSDERIETITYYDGLGRQMQNIVRQGGSNHEDIVIPIVYDGFGRQTKQYLPYLRSNSSLDIEEQNVTFFHTLNSQYLTKYGTDLDAAIPNPFSEEQLEASP